MSEVERLRTEASEEQHWRRTQHKRDTEYLHSEWMQELRDAQDRYARTADTGYYGTGDGFEKCRAVDWGEEK